MRRFSFSTMAASIAAAHFLLSLAAMYAKGVSLVHAFVAEAAPALPHFIVAAAWSLVAVLFEPMAYVVQLLHFPNILWWPSVIANSILWGVALAFAVVVVMRQ